MPDEPIESPQEPPESPEPSQVPTDQDAQEDAPERDEIKTLTQRVREQDARTADLNARLMTLAIAHHAHGILADPSDLEMFTDVSTLTDDDGNPDPIKIRDAAEELARSKQHLGYMHPAGSVGQGARPEAVHVSLLDEIRSRI